MTKKETKQQIKIEEEFVLLNNSKEVDDIPDQVLFRNPKLMEEMFDFFRKIPNNKAMRVKFPNELLWKSYNTKLRYYASRFKESVFAIRSLRNSKGYFIYVKKKKKEVTE